MGAGKPRLDDDLFPYGKRKGTPLWRITDYFWGKFLQSGAAIEWPSLAEYAEARTGSKQLLITSLVRKDRSEIDSLILGDDDEMPLGPQMGKALGKIPNDYWRKFLIHSPPDSWISLRKYAESRIAAADKNATDSDFIGRDEDNE